MLKSDKGNSIISSLPELKLLDIAGLKIQAGIIRQFLIENISKTGGHIGANLSVVELTMAIHYVFESPVDKIIFDTGHQGYTHKLLTGREGLFPSLNTYKGMNRFIAREESIHDVIDASHAGTSLSIASGYSHALKSSSPDNFIVAVIGDGTLVEGMAFEGLNYCSEKDDANLVIVINDNEMAIASSVGGMSKLTSGHAWQDKSSAFFQAMGFDYIAVEDGHDIEAMVTKLCHAKSLNRPVVVHVKTEKGKGLACAKDHPYKMHFSMPFNPVTGEGASATIAGRTYAVVAAEQLFECMKEDDNIYAMTAATPYASSLDKCLSQFPDRAIDVGMAEQHAVGMACGLALGGKKPVVCIQTTFMQRAYDQLIHDVCYMNLPVTILGVRSGFSGYDGATHHGLYDIPYLRSFPNMQVVYPVDSQQLSILLKKRLEAPEGPMTILYPYESIPQPEPKIGEMESCGLTVISEGNDGVIICLGNRLVGAYELKAALAEKDKDFGIVCIQNIKPFPSERIIKIVSSDIDIITLEESVLSGGFGSLILETLSDANISKRVLRSGVDDSFVSPGDKNECSHECNMTTSQIMDKLMKFWPDYKGE